MDTPCPYFIKRRTAAPREDGPDASGFFFDAAALIRQEFFWIFAVDDDGDGQ